MNFASNNPKYGEHLYSTLTFNTPFKSTSTLTGAVISDRIAPLFQQLNMIYVPFLPADASYDALCISEQYLWSPYCNYREAIYLYFLFLSQLIPQPMWKPKRCLLKKKVNRNTFFLYGLFGLNQALLKRSYLAPNGLLALAKRLDCVSAEVLIRSGEKSQIEEI